MMTMMKLNELPKGTMLYALASAHLKVQKEYRCIVGGKKTTITK